MKLRKSPKRCSGREEHKMAQELSQRQLRVGQEVRRVIAQAIEQGEVRSPELSEAFITITQVVMSPDLKYATVYLTTLNGRNMGVVLEQLTAEKWLFKKLVADKLKLRWTPEINFRVDDTFDEVERINKLMNDPKVKADLTEE
ncbi:MAG: 30S ribosome-binding factor RbfA, partial [Alphaproteobacteria bacterium]|nr:30S ribosome-binding factor RbfA [Alphaproteobacteria bacterium]